MSINLDELTASVTVDMRRGRRKFKVAVSLDWDEEWWASDVFPPDGLTLTLSEERRCCARAKRYLQTLLTRARWWVALGEKP